MNEQTKEDIIKLIDGDIFYRYDYTDFLYKRLETDDILIEMKSKRIKQLMNKISRRNEEIERLSKEVDMWNRKYNEQVDITNELENYILNHYIVGHTIQNASLDDILNKLKELKEGGK